MPSKFIAKSITAFVVHVGLIDIIAITTYDILGTWDDGSRLTNAGLWRHHKSKMADGPTFGR